MSRFIGPNPIAICDRCRVKVPHSSLKADPNSPGLMVCGGCRDLYDPYRLPPRATENITLRFVRPDESVASDEADTIALFTQILATENNLLLNFPTDIFIQP